jgi:hypothetical protein
MSSVQAYANRLAWVDRAENGRSAKARDPWAVARLRHRFLSSEQWVAACRFAALLERAEGQGKGRFSEFLEGGDADPHARLWDQAASARAANAASLIVRRAVPAVDYDLFLRAFETPHPTVEALSPGDRHHPRLARRIMPALDALATYFDACDADRKMWAKIGA